MIYFDNAATTLKKPPETERAVLEAMRHCASVGRGGHLPAMRAAQEVFACREEAAALFDASPEQVVFTFHATHGLNIAIRSLVSAGDRVVISGFEHNAVLRPLFAIGAEICPAGRRLFNEEDTVRQFAKAMTPETRAVVCTHVSNVFGYVLPIERIAALCRERGIPLVVDASQSAGILPLSLRALSAAFIAMPGHKALYGPQGTGILLCGHTAKPILQGGTGSISDSREMPDFLPDQLEAGTHNVPGIAGLAAGLRFVRSRTPQAIARSEDALLLQAVKGMRRLEGVHVFAAAHGRQTGVLSFTAKGIDCETLAQRLARCGACVRAGLHCAPLAHESAGTKRTGTVRLSFSVWNTPREVSAFLRILQSVCRGAEQETTEE